MSTSKDLITGFKQGGTGNCVSIAVIKAGIEIFGINKVLFHQKIENKFDISMRDGYRLKLSNEELEIAQNQSSFIQGTDIDILNYANFLFGAMAKRAQEENNDGNENMTFEESTVTLNDGEYYLEGPHWLGLRHHIRNIGRRNGRYG